MSAALHTLKARLDANDPGLRMKPDMFVNVEFGVASDRQLGRAPLRTRRGMRMPFHRLLRRIGWRRLQDLWDRRPGTPPS